MLKLTKIRAGPSGGSWTGFMDQFMDQVHRGGPCTRSTGVIHGVWSMFCIRPHCRIIF